MSTQRLLSKCDQRLMRQNLERFGWHLIDNVPNQSHAEAILSQIGTLIRQDHGELRYLVEVSGTFANTSSSKSANSLKPHTEASNYPDPPKYVALWCDRQANCGGGQTTLADGCQLFQMLDASDRVTVTDQDIRFGDSSRTIHSVGKIVTLQSGEPTLIRFSYNLLRHGVYDPIISNNEVDCAPRSRIAKVAESLLNLFTLQHIAIDIRQHGLLIWDNFRMLHSRRRYRDQRRRLIRYWLTERDIDSVF